MKNKIKKLILLSLFMYAPFSSMAWGVLGHRIIGQIADCYLTKKTRKEIYKILGNESVAITSNWPDFIKSDPTYSYLSPWHYINLKAGLTETELKAYLATDSATDAYTKLNWLTQQLKNKDLEQDKKVLYLRLVIHIVGDLHQPLHVGRHEDLGGNKIRITWFKEPYNLHQVWDEQLIDFQQLSYTEYAAAINYTTKEQRKLWHAETVSDWIWQSYQLAEKIYSDIKPDEKLSYQYNFKYIASVNEQLLKGGVRLAGLLNEIFS
ncbi:MAG: S1/P1 nuclease [Ferruginibacter sp.]|nr:S1/P1 nuclease [Bacteroidota bacterium]MBX2918232.1 S1/P1 nuclease [Ferruginibacter sp.]MCC7377830.1 S1/P1 nuclease [Chitinophagaceae bacterium]